MCEMSEVFTEARWVGWFGDTMEMRGNNIVRGVCCAETEDRSRLL